MLGAAYNNALSAATFNGAQVCGLEDITGVLEKGKRSDIIAVTANPFDDIMTLRDIRCVFLDGEVILKLSKIRLGFCMG